jgi:hypothetical protein
MPNIRKNIKILDLTFPTLQQKVPEISIYRTDHIANAAQIVHVVSKQYGSFIVVKNIVVKNCAKCF